MAGKQNSILSYLSRKPRATSGTAAAPVPAVASPKRGRTKEKTASPAKPSDSELGKRKSKAADADEGTPTSKRLRTQASESPKKESNVGKAGNGVNGVHSRSSPQKATRESPRKRTRDESLKVVDLEPTAKPKVQDVPKSKSPVKKQVSPEVPKPRPSPAKTSRLTSSSVTPKPSAAATVAKPQILAPRPGLTAEEKLWVDKYRPTTLKQLVGQAGESSNAKKLYRWLENWFKHHGHADDKVKAAYPGLKDNEGRTFKAALLSGPPGVGKTTTAHLVCKELGFDFFEMNASDTRSQKGLRALLSDALSSQSLFYGSKGDPGLARKHAVIMDEVDGMAGNEDRGGVSELLSLMKSSRVPIICICNDRNAQKIRTLAQYCFDLRFTKPRNEQLKGFVTSICFKEKLRIPPETLQRLIIGSDQDIRQILHQLQLFRETPSVNAYDPKKDIRLTNWDVIRKVFAAQEHEKMTLTDKMGLFFQDYSFGPLFVQENYLKCTPIHANNDRKKTLEAIRRAAESLVYGDLTERAIRSSNQWSLLTTQAIFSSVLPGEYMEGYGCNPDFPQWFGKNSNQGKRSRLLQQLQTHMHLHTSGSLEALNMDYAPYLRRLIVGNLASGKGDEAAGIMRSYDLLRDDLETLQEIAMWPNMRDVMSTVDSKTKASFTRAVNKNLVVPYALDTLVTKKRRGGSGGFGDGYGSEEDEELSGSDDDDLSKDASIKMKTKKGPTGKKGAEESGTAKKTQGKRGKK